MPSSAPTPLPISVVIPTRDSMDKLPRHLAHHAPIFSRCAEIIHCDSHSKDGTRAFVAAELSYYNLRQFDHPPGLYQSWNFAIQQCTQPFIYFSTVGDEIDLSGLQQLHALALKTEADVVISPPRLIEETGRQNDTLLWPIHHLIRNHGINTPGIAPNHLLYAEAVFHAPDGILGSSASCLYRASFLKPRPFPTGFHGACDTVWALRHLPLASCALLPTPVSTFLLHPKTYDSHEMLNMEIAVLVRSEISRALQKTSSLRQKPSPFPEPLLERLRAFNIIALLRARQEKQLRTTRKAMHGLWLLSSKAWSARKYRDRYRHLTSKFYAEARNALALTPTKRHDNDFGS